MTTIKDHVLVLKEGTTLLPGLEAEFPFPPHAPTHEIGGTDEIDLDKINGVLDFSKTYVLSLPDRGTVTGQQAIDFHGSAGSAEETYLTTSGTDVIVAAGNGYIKKTDVHAAPLYACDWPASSKTIAVGEVWYVGVVYDSGTDRGLVEYHASYDWDGHTDFALGSVTRDATGLHVLNNPQQAADIAQHAHHRWHECQPFQRADRLGGLIIG
jgi:hypothetical protein